MLISKKLSAIFLSTFVFSQTPQPPQPQQPPASTQDVTKASIAALEKEKDDTNALLQTQKQALEDLQQQVKDLSTKRQSNNPVGGHCQAAPG